MSSSRIVELAETIQKHTQIFNDYLVSHGLPAPSFDIDQPPRLSLPPPIQASQAAILEASDELTALTLGPVGTLMGRHPFNAWSSIQAIETFGIAKAFPLGERATFEAIASSCALSESDTRRILRHAMTHYIFREPSPGVVEHTAASKALSEIVPLAALVGFLSNEMWPAATRMKDALLKWPQSEEPNETGYSLANGTDASAFDFIDRDPVRSKRMAEAMSFMHSGPGYSVRHVIDHFDWGPAVQGTLVDVGGGQGTVASEIARTFPSMRCIVQDLPKVIESAQVPEDLHEGNRLQFMAHNFFEEQPVIGADIYHLRWVLHDWSDQHAIRILRNLVPALRTNSRVLVSELCLPPTVGLSPYKMRPARTFDLGMKALQNAKERDADDWAHLFQLADARFELEEISKPLDATLSIICAKLDDVQGQL